MSETKVQISRRVCMTIDCRGGLRTPPGELRGVLTTDDGRPLSDCRRRGGDIHRWHRDFWRQILEHAIFLAERKGRKDLPEWVPCQNPETVDDVLDAIIGMVFGNRRFVDGPDIFRVYDLVIRCAADMLDEGEGR